MESNQVVKREGPVRIDLVGGTLDLFPINLIVPETITINFAISLKSKVQITSIPFKGIELISNDYQLNKKIKMEEFCPENFNNNFFGELNFVARIIGLFGLNKRLNKNQGVQITISSDAPHGGGLGGSSTMGMTLYRALSDFLGLEFVKEEALSKVKDVEAIILNSGPSGYQDYYPSVFGGVLALSPIPGRVVIEQLYSNPLKEFLENHLTLVYSGESRSSGLNNWEIYKSFFDKNLTIQGLLKELALVSRESYQAIKNEKFSQLISLVSMEGEIRKKLAPGIMTGEMNLFLNELRNIIPKVGLKPCGAGGGGCFILLHESKDKKSIENYFDNCSEKKFKKINFKIEAPLQ
jgi:D-glycero-alpha-D-manno-heptose-7-phosphate kinase